MNSDDNKFLRYFTVIYFASGLTLSAVINYANLLTSSQNIISIDASLIVTLSYYLGIFVWTIIYFIQKIVRKNILRNADEESITWNKILSCWRLGILDFFGDALGVVVIATLSIDFSYFLRGLTLPLTTYLLARRGSKISFVQKGGAIIVTISSITMTIVAVVVYFIEKGSLQDGLIASGCGLMFVILNGFVYVLIKQFYIDNTNKDSTAEKPRPMAIVAFAGLWKILLLVATLLIFNFVPLKDGKPIVNTLEMIKKFSLVWQDTLIFLVFIPIAYVVYNLIFVKIIYNFWAGYGAALMLIRNVIFFIYLTFVTIKHDAIVITFLQTCGNLILLYGCLVYLDINWITPVSCKSKERQPILDKNDIN